MKPGTPFVAFSLHPSDDALHVSTLDGSRVAKNQVQESTFSDLEAFNLRGLDESAMIIGKYVLGLLYMSHPDKFKLYPNLIIKTEAGPTPKEIEQMNKQLDQMDRDDKV